MYPKGEKCSKVLSKIDDIFHDQEMKLILYFHLTSPTIKNKYKMLLERSSHITMHAQIIVWVWSEFYLIPT